MLDSNTNFGGLSSLSVPFLCAILFALLGVKYGNRLDDNGQRGGQHVKASRGFA